MSDKAAMLDPLMLVVHIYHAEGRFADLMAFAEHFTTKALAQNPDLLSYEWIEDREANKIRTIEIYASDDGLSTHSQLLLDTAEQLAPLRTQEDILVSTVLSAAAHAALLIRPCSKILPDISAPV